MSPNPRQDNDASREAWDANASFWDERMGDGNAFYDALVWPATERLLAARAGHRVLDIACGNGVTSRRLAQAGVTATAVDFSTAMLSRARARGDGEGLIKYVHLDCTDEGALQTLGKGVFDAAVATMALHDMAQVAPLFRGLAAVLKPGATFVFSVPHPAFNSTHAVMVSELEDVDGELRRSLSIKVRQYLEPTVTRGVAMDGQPRAQPYFNRPLSVLLGAAFDAGFVVDGLEETAFPPSEQSDRLNWVSFPHIPPVLILRVRAAYTTADSASIRHDHEPSPHARSADRRSKR
jgi:SAM-dependent methyltransferase